MPDIGLPAEGADVPLARSFKPFELPAAIVAPPCPPSVRLIIVEFRAVVS
jgi:hypothetical protein